MVVIAMTQRKERKVIIRVSSAGIYADWLVSQGGKWPDETPWRRTRSGAERTLTVLQPTVR